MYKNILFDLDGTLTDPGVGITNSVSYALERMGVKPPKRQALYCFIGPPLVDSFMKYYAFSEKEADEAVEYYRENFRETGIFENEVYEGIPKMLESMKAKGKIILLATSKPEEFAIRILDHFNLSQYFDFICGASMNGKRSKKGDVIAYALEKAGISDKENTVMVGDRAQDIIGAKENNIDSIGVLFGYGDRGELESAGATCIAESVKDILSLV